jgi:hypothetical protein
MKKAEIDLAAALAVADRPGHVGAANRYVGSLDRDWFIPVGTIHPGLSVEENRTFLTAADVRAVKLHPLLQGYALDNRTLWEILDSLQGELPVHVGDAGD